jgi:hypothetical protein
MNAMSDGEYPRFSSVNGEIVDAQGNATAAEITVTSEWSEFDAKVADLVALVRRVEHPSASARGLVADVLAAAGAEMGLRDEVAILDSVTAPGTNENVARLGIRPGGRIEAAIAALLASAANEPQHGHSHG